MTKHEGSSSAIRTLCFFRHLGFVIRSSKLRELDLNQHDDVQSVASCRWMIPHRFPPETRTVVLEFGEEGSNLRLLVQSQTAYH